MNEEYVPVLAAAIQDGKINSRDFQAAVSENKDLLFKTSSQNSIFKTSDRLGTREQDQHFSTSFWVQFCVLFGRMIVQLRRNKLAICIQLFHHTFVGISIGILFFGIGNDAKLAIANFNYSLLVVFFFVYTYLVTLILLFPAEVKILKREYFNRWYGLKPYFLALTLRNMPLVMILGLFFTLLTYLLSNQPLELYRFVQLTSVCFLTAFVCESAGLAIGSVCSITTGPMVGITLTAPGAFLCFYGMGTKITIGPVMEVLMSTNYIRCALVAVCLTLFENRPPFECNDIYCHYKYPDRLLRDLGMANKSYSVQVLVLVMYFLVFRLIAFIALRCRLSPEFSQKVVYMKTRTRQCFN